MKVKIKNYQIIKDAELEFKEGITAIIGPTNSGKSSIIRAIESAINNRAGNYFINHEAEATEVVIQENEQEIRWYKSRKSGDSLYEINGDKLSKIGVKQIDEVGEALNMGEIVVNNEKIRLNFWKQMTPPFLVNKTTNQLFEFISQSEEQEIMRDYQDATNKTIKELNDETNKLNTIIDSKTTDAESYSLLLDSNKRFLDFNLGRLEALFSLDSEVGEVVDKYKDLETRITYQKPQVDKLKEKSSGLSKILNQLGKRIDKFKTLYALQNNYTKACGEVENLIDTRNDTIKRVKQIENKVKQLDALMENITTTRELYNKINMAIISYDVVTKQITNANTVIINLKRDIDGVKTEMSTFKVCPLCGNDMSIPHTH